VDAFQLNSGHRVGASVALPRQTPETESVFPVGQFCFSCEPNLFFLCNVDRDEKSGADPLMGSLKFQRV
jgi:hypothetical protein